MLVEQFSERLVGCLGFREFVPTDLGHDFITQVLLVKQQVLHHFVEARALFLDFCLNQRHLGVDFLLLDHYGNLGKVMVDQGVLDEEIEDFGSSLSLASGRNALQGSLDGDLRDGLAVHDGAGSSNRAPTVRERGPSRSWRRRLASQESGRQKTDDRRRQPWIQNLAHGTPPRSGKWVVGGIRGGKRNGERKLGRPASVPQERPADCNEVALSGREESSGQAAGSANLRRNSRSRGNHPGKVFGKLLSHAISFLADDKGVPRGLIRTLVSSDALA